MTCQKLLCRIEKITDHGDHVYTVDLAPERPLPSFKPGQCVLRFRKVGKTFADLI
jgi:NAD(P)H-flavin reductase